jgi:peptidoglycan lytic transglycosylase
MKRSGRPGFGAPRLRFEGWMGRRFVPGMMQVARVGAAAAIAFALANCGRSNVAPKYGVEASRRVVEPGEPVPKGGGRYSVGKPYQVAGRTYVPEENANYEAEGMASWYGDDFHGRLTANGEVFDMNSISAAHPTLPIPSYARVTNLRNNKSLIVRVNDRGPFHENRVIDVSVRAAKLLDFHRFGVTRVKVEYVGRAALEGSDDAKLAATMSTGSPAGFPTVRVASAKPSLDPKPTVRTGTHLQRSAEPVRTVVRTTAVAAPQTAGRAPPAPNYSVASERAPPVQAPPPRVAASDGPASFESRFGPAPASSAPAAPASAFAPRFDGVMTGRGIY